MLMDLIRRCRSYRRFKQEAVVTMDTLRELVGFARLSASGANRQPLKFLLSSNAETNAKIFGCLAWAGALPDWPGPAEGERPAAYIVILGDTTVSKGFGVDYGIGAQSMMLAAVEKGLGGCMLGAINRDALRTALEIPERFEILLVLALGEPAEEIAIEDATDSVKYYRDEKDIHHVPKRTLEELIYRVEE